MAKGEPEKSEERQRIENAFSRGYSVLHDRKIYTRIEDVPAEAFNDPKPAERAAKKSEWME